VSYFVRAKTLWQEGQWVAALRAILSRIRREYFPDEYHEACAALENCHESSTRILGAILSLARGNLDDLRSYVATANADWRDVLLCQEESESARRREVKEAKRSEKVGSQEDAFLEAIRRRPAEYAPRLVYADWLEEQGDARADYVRLLCAWYRQDEGHETDALIARERQLRRGLDLGWLKKIRGMAAPENNGGSDSQ
jgi:uncharacterized protein (TIGR02996 family)